MVTIPAVALFQKYSPDNLCSNIIVTAKNNIVIKLLGKKKKKKAEILTAYVTRALRLIGKVSLYPE